MKLTVIGFWGGYPEKNEATSGYLLEAEGYKLLIDCGSGVLSQLQNYAKIETIDALWLSHYHHDHFADFGPLYYAKLISGQLTGSKSGLPAYGHALDDDAFQSLTNEEITQGVPYDENDVLNLGPFELTFLKTAHPVPCFATRITYKDQTIVYTADTSFIESLIPFSRGADLLIAESSLYEGQDGKAFGHLTCQEVATLAEVADVKDVLLTHLPHYGDHQDLLKPFHDYKNGQVQLAQSGWIWGANDGSQ